MVREAHVSHFALHIDGVKASPQMMDEILEFTVENSIHLPDMATFRIHDSDFKWLDSEMIQEGKIIEIRGGEEQNTLQSLFNGEITGLELDLAAQGVPTVVVRCLDLSHRLHRGSYNRSFVQMTDTDIVKKIGQEMEFNVDAESTSEVHDWIFQNNQTNWEFLTERAERNGFRLYVQGKKDLHFCKVDNKKEKVIKLEWGINLRSFRPRIAASQQVDEVVVRGWDTDKKVAIIGKWKVPSGIPLSTGNKSGGETANKAYGSARMVVVDRPVHSQQEAEDIARSICDSISGNYLQADGLCYGQPELQPGAYVEIKNIGKRFSGEYYVTATTHVYTPSEGYTTIFSVSGKQPNTLLSIMDQSKDMSRAKQGGNILIGVVTDNKDPENMGRVKVKYPTLTEDHTSHWARMVSPMAGKGRGLFILPEIDDEVLVAFEHGDIHRPYIIGMLWNGQDGLPETGVHGSGNVIDRRVFYSRIGHKMSFNDKDGKGDITLTTKGNNSFTMDDKESKISVTTAGGHLFTLDDGKNNKNIIAKTTSGHQIVLSDKDNTIIVKDKSGNNKITIGSNDNSIKMECNGNFTINSKGKVSIEGKAGVDVKTPAMMNLESSGPGTLKSGAILTINGSLVKIN